MFGSFPSPEVLAVAPCTAVTRPGYEAIMDGNNPVSARLCRQNAFCPGNIEAAGSVRGFTLCMDGKRTRGVGSISASQCSEWTTLPPPASVILNILLPEGLSLASGNQRLVVLYVIRFWKVKQADVICRNLAMKNYPLQLHWHTQRSTAVLAPCHQGPWVARAIGLIHMHHDRVKSLANAQAYQ